MVFNSTSDCVKGRLRIPNALEIMRLPVILNGSTTS